MHFGKQHLEVSRDSVDAATGAGFQIVTGLQHLAIVVAHGFTDFDNTAHVLPLIRLFIVILTSNAQRCQLFDGDV
jgi:hypothetical protein